MKRRFFIFFLVLIYLFNNIFVSTTLCKFTQEQATEKFSLSVTAYVEGSLVRGEIFSQKIVDAENVIFDIYSEETYPNFVWGEGETIDVDNRGTIQLFKDGENYYILSKDTIKANPHSKAMFKNCTNLKSIEFKNFDTSEVVYMDSIFYGCTNLENLDLSSFNTSKVIQMDAMFYNCSSLEELNLSGFDTKNVKSMANLFYGCSSLKTLDVSHFKTNNVRNMLGMFRSCSNLTELDLSNLDTSNVTNMAYMFYGFSNITTLDLSNFDTSKVTNMTGMFYAATSLKELDLSSFDTSQVTNMNVMFYNCTNLEKLDISSFDTKNVTDMRGMFYAATSLKELDLSNFDTSKVTTMRTMFYNCTNLEKLDLSSFNMEQVENTEYMFWNCKNLIYIYVTPELWELDRLEVSADMFKGASLLPNYNYSVLDKTNAHTNEGGYLTDIVKKGEEPSTLDLLPPFEMPEGFILGEAFIISEMPNFEEITEIAINNTPENTEYFGWLIENEFAQVIFEPEEAKSILEDTYSEEKTFELRLTPIYKVIVKIISITTELENITISNLVTDSLSNEENILLDFVVEEGYELPETVEIIIDDISYIINTNGENNVEGLIFDNELIELCIDSELISGKTSLVIKAIANLVEIEEETESNEQEELPDKEDDALSEGDTENEIVEKIISVETESLYNVKITEFVDLRRNELTIEEDLTLEFVLEEDYVLYKNIEILINDNSYVLDLTDEERELEGITFNSRKSILTIAYDLFENNSTLTIKAHALENIPLNELVSEQEISITEFTNSEDLYEMIELSENEEFIGWLINKDELEIHNIVLQDNLTDILTKIYGEQIEQEESINSLDTILEDVVLPGDELVAPEEELITTTLKPVLRITKNKQVEIDLSEYVLGEMISVNDTIETFDELLTLAIENTPENTEFYGWFIEYFNNEEIITHDELSSTILAIFSNGEITDKSVNLTPLYVSVEQETTETEQPEEKVEESTDPEDVPQEEQIPENVEKEESSKTLEENTSTEVEDDTTGNEPETDVNNSVEEIPSESIPTENTILINTDNLENISISNLSEDNTLSYTDNLTLKLKVEKDYKLPNTVEITIDKTYTINTNGENNPDGLEFNNSKITISTEYLIDIDTISINATAVLIEEQTEDETTSTDPEENVSKEPDKVEESTGTESTEQGTSQDEENPDEVTENKSSEKTEEESSTEIEESTNMGAEPEIDADNSMENIPTETLPTEPEDPDISNDENISNIENPESSNNVENETITSEPTSLPENNFVPDNINSPENMTKAEEYIPVVKEMYESSKNLNEPNTSIQGLEHDIVLLKEPTKVSTKEETTEPTKNNVSDLSNVKENLSENTERLSVSENSESSVTSVSVDKTVTVKDTITEPNKSATSTENSMPTTQNKTEKQKTVSESQTNNINNNSEKETSNSKSSEQTVNTTVKDTNVEKETSNKEE